ncbi:MAG: helix-turn-helix domain-containing protein [Micavibrio sp.]
MNAQAAKMDNENLPVGEILRRSRVYYNQSLDDVGAILRIRASHLSAIEEGRIDDLPGRVYAFGFVRAYAEYLGLDGEKIVRLLKTQLGVQIVDRPDLHMPVAASESKSPNAILVIGSLAFLSVAIGGLVFMGSRQDVEQEKKVAAVHEIPPVPQELYETIGEVGPFAPASTVTQSANPEGAAAEGATTAEQGAEVAVAEPVAEVPPPVVLKMVDSAWVEIRDASGKALLSRILKPGDSYIVPASVKGLILDTGNVGGIQFTVDGKVLSPFGVKGDVRRGIKLEAAYLKDLDARTPKQAAQ